MISRQTEKGGGGTFVGHTLAGCGCHGKDDSRQTPQASWQVSHDGRKSGETVLKKGETVM